MNHSNVDVVADLLLEKSKRDMAESYHHYDVRPMSDAIIDEQGEPLSEQVNRQMIKWTKLYIDDFYRVGQCRSVSKVFTMHGCI